jgi:6-phosphogluconolactonase
MSTHRKPSMVARSFQVTAALFLFLAITPHPGFAQGPSGAVYVLTNQSHHNSVMVFLRAPDGTLTFSGNFHTGGAGTGSGADPLGSEGALALDPSHRLLFAVNSGSNEVSVFAVDGQRLLLIDKVDSGGEMPVSITVFGRSVYVLNAGGTPNITGFTIDPITNRLCFLPGSRRKLAGGSTASPAQVAFSLDGSVLMVTEKGTNTIDTYAVDSYGYASAPMPHASSGATPFGFAFIHGGFVVVSEAGPNALSSYKVDEGGGLDLITGSLGDGQAATCWAVSPNNSGYAYVANAGSATISSYTIAEDGMLSLLDATAGSTASGSAPTDMALSSDGRFLYTRDGGNGTVNGFQVNADGSLTPVGWVGGVPAGAQGIAAR